VTVRIRAPDVFCSVLSGVLRNYQPPWRIAPSHHGTIDMH